MSITILKYVFFPCGKNTAKTFISEIILCVFADGQVPVGAREPTDAILINTNCICEWNHKA